MEGNSKAVFYPLSHFTDTRMAKGDRKDTRNGFRTMSDGEMNFMYLVISAALFFHPNIYISDILGRGAVARDGWGQDGERGGGGNRKTPRLVSGRRKGRCR